MNILLIDAPYDRLQGVKVTYNYSLGLAYLAAYLEKEGHNTLYLNLDWDLSLPASGSFSAESVMARYDEYLRQTSHDSAHPAWSEFADALKDFKPDLVGFSASTIKLKSVFKLVEITKECDPGIYTVLGGHHTQIFAREIMGNNKNVDFIVLGEGEETLAELAKGLSKQPVKRPESIAGLAFRDDAGNVRLNRKREFIKDLDSLPWPSPCYHYRGGNFVKLPKNAVITSRGCPYNCHYCATNNMWDKKVRRRTVEDVVAEIEHIIAGQKERFLSFYDDCFTLDRGWLIKFCDTIIKKRIRFNWQCITGVNLLDEDIFKKMLKAGCVKINIGIESGSKRILRLANKNIDLSKAKKVFNFDKKYKICTTAYIMTGFPTETEDDIKSTQRIIKEIRPHWVYCSALIPLPGTVFYDTCVKNGLIDPTDAWSGGSIKNIIVNYTNTMPDREFIRLTNETFDTCHKINTNVMNLLRRAPITSYFSSPKSFLNDMRRIAGYIKTR